MQLEEDPVFAEDLLVKGQAVLRFGDEREEALAVSGEFLGFEPRHPLGIRHLCLAYQPAKVGIAGLVFGDQQQTIAPTVVVDAILGRGRAIVDGELGADDRLDAGALSGAEELDRAIEAVAIGNRERRHFQVSSARHQFLGV